MFKDLPSDVRREASVALFYFHLFQLAGPCPHAKRCKYAMACLTTSVSQELVPAKRRSPRGGCCSYLCYKIVKDLPSDVRRALCNEERKATKLSQKEKKATLACSHPPCVDVT